MTWLLSLILKPLVFFGLFVLVLLPARRAVERMKDSRLKRLLLRRIK